MAAQILIHRAVIDELLTHARSEPSVECCGLLAGRDGIITTVFRTKNALASATAYEIAPMELFELFRRMREEYLDHLGIYHSHPVGENAPSRSDIAQAHYPETPYFIISPRPETIRSVRAFSISDGRVEELEIVLVLA